MKSWRFGVILIIDIEIEILEQVKYTPYLISLSRNMDYIMPEPIFEVEVRPFIH